MRVAAPVLEHGVADVIQRRAVLAGRQRVVGGPGEILKIHWSFFSHARRSHVALKPPVPEPVAAPAARKTRKPLKNCTKGQEIQMGCLLPPPCGGPRRAKLALEGGERGTTAAGVKYWGRR